MSLKDSKAVYPSSVDIKTLDLSQIRYKHYYVHYL